MCDAVLALEAVQDDSPAVRLLSDPDRCDSHRSALIHFLNVKLHSAASGEEPVSSGAPVIMLENASLP